MLHYTIPWDPDLARNNELVLSHQAMVDKIARSSIELLKSEGKTRPAFLHMEEAGFNLGAKYIREVAAEQGLNLTADEAFNPNETDFRSLLARVEKKDPDCYLLWAVMPSIDTLIRQIRQRKPQASITGYLDYTDDLTLLQDARYVSEMYAEEGFARDFQRSFGSAPISKGPNAYDIMKLLIAAYESSADRKLSSPEVKNYLIGVRNFPGAVGLFSIDEQGNSTYAPVIRTIKGKERSLVRQGS